MTLAREHSLGGDGPILGHGLTGYCKGGCRCEVCRQANRDHMRAYRAVHREEQRQAQRDYRARVKRRGLELARRVAERLRREVEADAHYRSYSEPNTRRTGSSGS